MNNPIEHIDEIATPSITKNTLGDYVHVYDLGEKKVELSSHTYKAYQDALNPGVPLRVRLKRFFTATSYAGKQAKIFKDFFLIFLPWGETVDDVTQLITKQIQRTMPETKEKSRSRTIRIFGLLCLAGILMQAEVLPETLALSPDAAWVLIASSIVGIIMRLITGKPVELGPTLDRVIGILKDE